MLFAIICTDRPGALELRVATRAQHLAFLESHKAAVQFAGPQLDAQGKPCGSLILLDVPDRESAEGFAAADPYAGVNLFESVIVRPLRTVFRDGQLVA
ncbi:YciI family protein [Acetobacter sp. TBRC 12305]|uniref:YciI family protein n=1 Tax=Acetobacter garciniae TaxID=2817435 RepID=A0A939KPG4_9PROT|nr:YciI family protein [Acetobacter garciniae]MBO1323862.1 YciI family protein [Acetobacter garciniae]MBX0343551.1 YciI family protein [Acetobacter garciniae]